MSDNSVELVKNRGRFRGRFEATGSFIRVQIFSFILIIGFGEGVKSGGD